MKMSHLALLAIAASAAIGLAPIASADVSVQQEMRKSLLLPEPRRNRQPNSSSHSPEMWALCCSTTDLVHPAVC